MKKYTSEISSERPFAVTTWVEKILLKMLDITFYVCLNSTVLVY